MDRNYLNRITQRKRLIAEHTEDVVAALDVSKPAVDEFYAWIVGTYLPTRFPTMFRLRPHPETQMTELYSHVTGKYHSLVPKGGPQASLAVLGGLVEDDLLFLMPADDGDSYELKAFVTCFPNGFNTRQKLGLKLRDIHTPVPGYKEKLQKSMDRWFNRLEVGTFVRRYNVRQLVELKGGYTLSRFVILYDDSQFVGLLARRSQADLRIHLYLVDNHAARSTVHHQRESSIRRPGGRTC